MGYGAQATGNSPYAAAFPQAAAAFAPQGSTGLQSGQKRDSGYDQVCDTSWTAGHWYTGTLIVMLYMH